MERRLTWRVENINTFRADEVYGRHKGAAPQPRSRERLAETRGEDRSDVLCRCFDSDSDAKSAAPKANPANHPSQNCACARIPTRSARRANEFVFTIRRNLAGLPDHARSPRGSSSSAPHPHARHDLPAGPRCARGRTQIATGTGITVSTRAHDVRSIEGTLDATGLAGRRAPRNADLVPTVGAAVGQVMTGSWTSPGNEGARAAAAS